MHVPNAYWPNEIATPRKHDVDVPTRIVRSDRDCPFFISGATYGEGRHRFCEHLIQFTDRYAVRLAFAVVAFVDVQIVAHGDCIYICNTEL